MSIEASIERVHLLNKETLIVSDIIIDFRDKLGYGKHRPAKGLLNLHFKQFVDFITRPVSRTCLDHVYCNRPQHINLVTSHNIGLADHLAIFVVRKYARRNRMKTILRIKYEVLGTLWYHASIPCEGRVV